MPRKPIERSREHYYHITARSNNREYFYLPTNEVWKIMTARLARLQAEHQIEIAAFVLMNNHFHLLMRTPNEDIDRCMYFFMKGVTLDIQKASGRINKIFGGRYKGSLIDTPHYLYHVYKYIYRNPIEVGLCNRVEDYPYSTLSASPFKVEECLEVNQEAKLKWLNVKFDQSDSESISRGLKKTVFKFNKKSVLEPFLARASVEQLGE